MQSTVLKKHRILNTLFGLFHPHVFCYLNDGDVILGFIIETDKSITLNRRKTGEIIYSLENIEFEYT
jgi:hypothetical protein